MKTMETIARQFQLDGGYLHAQPFGSGHIHDTYHLRTDAQPPGNANYILQRINHRVFPDPPTVMDNMSRVTRHIRRKLENQPHPPPDIDRRVLTIVPTREGEPFYRDPEGGYWRVFLFITGARTLDVLRTENQLRQAALGFGGFLRMLEDFPPPPLAETIPGFHDGPARLAQFHDALAQDPHNRALAAKPEIDFLLSRAGDFAVLPDQVKKGKLVYRVTHNDTKVNNIMLDDVTGEALCVIDLDTVMPGLVPYDFGDLVRSALFAGGEDDENPEPVDIDPGRFGAILGGFLEGAGDISGPGGGDYLVFSARLMPLLIGMRFLTDHLLGDVYFKTHRPGHNLHRCRRQFNLVRSVIGKTGQMRDILRELQDENQQGKILKQQ